MEKVLVVDDEAHIRRLLEINLSQEGYTVVGAADGEEGYQLALQEDFAFIILDLMLPKISGMDVCRKLRQAKIKTPILMLTAKDNQIEKIIGLELGADDYMTKPFSVRELLARMRAISRRLGQMEEEQHAQAEVPTHKTSEVESPKLQVGEITLDLEAFSVRVRGQEVTMTPKEFALLAYMMKRPNRTLSREPLLEQVWDFAYAGETRLVDVHISHLREKIEEDAKHPAYIQTVRGFGYKLTEPER